LHTISSNSTKDRTNQESPYSKHGKRAPGQRVATVSRFIVILFSAYISQNASGGHLKPDPYNNISHLAAEYGPDAAGEVAEFEQAHVDVIRELVETEKIDCDLVMTKAIDVQLMPRESKKAKAAFDHLRNLGVKSVRRVSFSDEREAEDVRPSLHAV
jgi:hypothetical protein